MHRANILDLVRGSRSLSCTAPASHPKFFAILTALHILVWFQPKVAPQKGSPDRWINPRRRNVRRALVSSRTLPWRNENFHHNKARTPFWKPQALLCLLVKSFAQRLSILHITGELSTSYCPTFSPLTSVSRAPGKQKTEKAKTKSEQGLSTFSPIVASI